MSDDLERLKSVLGAATPAPDPAARRAAIAAAREKFDGARQGSEAQARPTQDRPTQAGYLKGLLTMLNTLTSRQTLTATTALATIALAVGLTWQMGYSPVERLLTGPTTVAVDAEVQEAKTQPMALSVPQSEASNARARQSTRTAEPLLFAAPAPPSPTQPQPLADAQSIGAMQSPTPMTGLRTDQSQMLLEREVLQPETRDDERFANAPQSALKAVDRDPVSTFSIDVDTASYAFMRANLMAGQRPSPDAIRVEELINYFNYGYAAPNSVETPFQPSVTVMETPWNPDTKLIQIGIKGYETPLADRPPLDLVFLIDTSGSMNQPNKLPLLKASFRLLLSSLKDTDKVAIVTYAGSAGTVLEPTPASERRQILESLDRLSAGGSTAGAAGLQGAYGVAEEMAGDGRIGRVILATDGDFNVGISDPESLKSFISDKRDSGIYLSVLGFGRGNINDALMQALAQNGNGQAAYIDTLAEAERVLVSQAGGALIPIANDVKIQVEFNPAAIAEYRLIGYETRALRREDFNNDRVDAGEIGSGHTVTALYEVTPVGSLARRLDPLRYETATDAAPAPAADTDELAFLRLRYKRPGESRSILVETPVHDDATEVSRRDADWAAAVAGFGELLRDGAYQGDWDLDDALALATGATGDDPFGYRREFLRLARIAAGLDAN